MRYELRMYQTGYAIFSARLFLALGNSQVPPATGKPLRNSVHRSQAAPEMAKLLIGGKGQGNAPAANEPCSLQPRGTWWW
jgi:hypothetical protein